MLALLPSKTGEGTAATEGTGKTNGTKSCDETTVRDNAQTRLLVGSRTTRIGPDDHVDVICVDILPVQDVHDEDVCEF